MTHINERRVSKFRVCRTDCGYLVQVEGRGTVKLSPLLSQFVIQSIEMAPKWKPTSVAVDLSSCDYLDSTFLGCLLSLNRRFNRAGDSRFLVVATAETRRLLLEPSNMDRVIAISETCPASVSDPVELTSPALLNADLGQHVLECHRLLAEHDGPNKAAYRSIASQLDAEFANASTVLLS